MNIPLTKARALADRVICELRPFCDRIAVTGEVRMEMPTVGLIEIVCLPNDREGLLDRVKRHSTVGSVMPRRIQLFMANGFPVVLHMAKQGSHELFDSVPGSFYPTLFETSCSPSFLEWFLSLAKKKGLRWDSNHGLLGPNGQWIGMEDEILAAVDLPHIEASNRNCPLPEPRPAAA